MLNGNIRRSLYKIQGKQFFAYPSNANHFCWKTRESIFHVALHSESPKIKRMLCKSDVFRSSLQGFFSYPMACTMCFLVCATLCYITVSIDSRRKSRIWCFTTMTWLASSTEVRHFGRKCEWMLGTCEHISNQIQHKFMRFFIGNMKREIIPAFCKKSREINRMNQK